MTNESKARDYFAGIALRAILTIDPNWKSLENQARKNRTSINEEAAKAAYCFADAMIKERNKNEK